MGVAAVRTQVHQEKEKYEEVHRVQTEERIKAIVRDYEKRLEEGKSALEHHNHLRQVYIFIKQLFLSGSARGIFLT